MCTAMVFFLVWGMGVGEGCVLFVVVFFFLNTKVWGPYNAAFQLGLLMNNSKVNTSFRMKQFQC